MPGRGYTLAAVILGIEESLGNQIEPVIGHMKNEHRMGRNYLAGTQGDAINAILAGVRYNIRLLLGGLRPSYA